jgi:hypothetical protein
MCSSGSEVTQVILHNFFNEKLVNLLIDLELLLTCHRFRR